MENKAMVAVWITVDSKNIEEFREWHNCEHSTDRLEGPGFRVCLRYNSSHSTKEFRILNIFEGENLETFNSKYYLESRNNPTPWTKKCMTFIKNPVRMVFELEKSFGKIPEYQAPYIHTSLFNLEGSKEIFLEFFGEKIKNLLAQSKNIFRCRILSKNQKLSEGKTKESEIQGNNPSEHDFLLLSETDLESERSKGKIEQAFYEIECQNALKLKVQNLAFEKWSLDFMKTKLKK